ncbi:hypothetical protein [Brevundimonas sp.]|uniref:hypothetical protein n=1 Tax=Brevundimonas sp. TaxID=1871086 RepID=UPI0025BA6DCC|nr:hypothetical protein [Brevundimonas sp.]
MDAIDEVRLKIATLEAQLSILNVERSPGDMRALEQRVSKIEAVLPSIENKSLEGQAIAVMASGQAAMLQDSLLRLTNQVAIVAATLGSAIHALKRGDTSASDKALSDALASQERLGSMLNEVSGRSR